MSRMVGGTLCLSLLRCGDGSDSGFFGFVVSGSVVFWSACMLSGKTGWYSRTSRALPVSAANATDETNRTRKQQIVRMVWLLSDDVAHVPQGCLGVIVIDFC